MARKDVTPDEALRNLGNAVVEALYLEQILNWLTDKLTKAKCRLGWHDWDMYSGFYEERVHPSAHCRDCRACYEH